MEEKIKLRPAITADTRALAELLDMAGEGIPAFVWQKLAKTGETALDVGVQRAAERRGSFSHGPVIAAEFNGQIGGMLLGYRLPEPYVTGNLQDYPEIVRPLVELEALAPGSWYVNAVAAFEYCRGKGIGSRLMAEAERLGKESGASRMSLIVANENSGARHLYEKLGYRPVATRAVVPFSGFAHGGDWVLMIKKLV